MKVFLLFSLVLSCCGSILAETASILVARDGHDMDLYAVKNGTWSKEKTFVKRSAKCANPVTATFCNGIVYVGDRIASGPQSKGRILKYSPDGTYLGIFKELSYRPDCITVSPDEKWLYVSCAFDREANSIFRYRLDNASGGRVLPGKTTGALSTPRQIAFGPDGFLYVANRGTSSICTFDLSQPEPKCVGAIRSSAASSGGFLLNPLQCTITLPGVSACTVNLRTKKFTTFPGHFSNVFTSLAIDGIAYFGDFNKGMVSRVDEKGVTPVAQHLPSLCGLFNLGAAISGTARQEYLAAAQALRNSSQPLAYGECAFVPDDDFQDLPYNTSGSCFLKTGLICYPMVMDYDGDGDLDLVVSNAGIPTWNGTWFFENPTPKGKKCAMPLFKPAKKVGGPEGRNRSNISSKTMPDGTITVVHGNRLYKNFAQNGFSNPLSFKGLPWNVHYNHIRCNLWRLVDFDGDGRDDLTISVGDWTQYGWHDAYDARGNWKNGRIHGLLYWVRNLSTGQTEKWGEPTLLRQINEEPVEVFGNPIAMFEDWDRDGDLDLICGDFVDSFTYFENIGTRTVPAYTSGRLLLNSTGKRMCGELCIMTPTSVDWDQDGHIDIICGEEDGRVAFHRNTGMLKNGLPVFDPPAYFRQERDLVHFGILSTPAGVDWDGDGDWDFLAGNSAGHLAFFENLSGKGVANPQWAEPVLLKGGDEIIRIMAGHNGSIQGPAEAKWGYTTLSVADWDGDTLPDVMVNSIWGDILWYKNIGTRTQPKLGPAQDVIVEWDGPQPRLDWGWYTPEKKKNPKALLTQWRTTPVMIDWDQDGLTDLLIVDTKGDLAFFQRAIVNGKKILRAPQYLLCDENGKPLHPAAQISKKNWLGGRGGASGRRKICVADWDGDGKMDLIMNGRNAQLYRQIGMKDGKWLFKDMGAMANRALAAHTTHPTAVDFNDDKIPDILLGAEDGFFYLLKNPRKP